MKRHRLTIGLVLGAALGIQGAAQAAMSEGEAMRLARQSGCLACHSIDKKVVGPAWSDVSLRYRGKALEAIKTELVQKVSDGGKGNWTEITGGVPMPPYGQRVPAEDIERLVEFVLSIARD